MVSYKEKLVCFIEKLSGLRVKSRRAGTLTAHQLNRIRFVSLMGFILILAGIVTLLSGGSQGLTGSPPVDIIYSSSGITTQSGIYYDRITLHNHGSDQVNVVASIKTGLDFSPRSSEPIQLCSGCSSIVYIKELQPGTNQTPEQNSYMMNLMTHPDYIRVSYASAPAAGLSGSAIMSGFVIMAGVSLLAYSFRGKALGHSHSYDYEGMEEPDEPHQYDDEYHVSTDSVRKSSNLQICNIHHSVKSQDADGYFCPRCRAWSKKLLGKPSN